MAATPHNQFPHRESLLSVYRGNLFTVIAGQPGMATEELPNPAHASTLGLYNRQPATSLADEKILRIGNKIVTQELQAVVKAGGELFAIIDTASIRQNAPAAQWRHHYVVTRIDREGRPATLVGVVPQRGQLEVGRAGHTDYSLETSRRHFMVANAPALAGVVINDTDSKWHTVVTYKPLLTEAAVGLNGLRAASGRTVPNPLEDSRIWSMDETEAAVALGRMENGRAGLRQAS